MIPRRSWPPLVVAAACLGVVAYCLLSDKWPGLAALALGGAIFCGVSLRMKGRFGFRGPGVEIQGEFDNPFEEDN